MKIIDAMVVESEVPVSEQDLPEPVRKFYQKEYAGNQIVRIDGCRIAGASDNEQPQAVIPTAFYDISETPIIRHEINVKQIGRVRISGLEARFYVRENKEEMGYIIIDDYAYHVFYYVEV